MTPTLQLFLIISAALFCIGLLAALSRRHAIFILIGIEMMLAAAGLNFIAFWRFGPQAAPRPATATAQTPVDMTRYADRLRLEPMTAAAGGGSIDRLASTRVSVARRPPLEIPHARADGVSAAAQAASSPTADDGGPEMAQSGETDPDFDLSSTFDTPAFLRRQES